MDGAAVVTDPPPPAPATIATLTVDRIVCTVATLTVPLTKADPVRLTTVVPAPAVTVPVIHAGEAEVAEMFTGPETDTVPLMTVVPAPAVTVPVIQAGEALVADMLTGPLTLTVPDTTVEKFDTVTVPDAAGLATQTMPPVAAAPGVAVVRSTGTAVTVPETSTLPRMAATVLTTPTDATTTGTVLLTEMVPLTAGMAETLIVPLTLAVMVPLTCTGPDTCTVPLTAGIPETVTVPLTAGMRDTSTTRPYCDPPGIGCVLPSCPPISFTRWYSTLPMFSAAMETPVVGTVTRTLSAIDGLQSFNQFRAMPFRLVRENQFPADALHRFTF